MATHKIVTKYKWRIDNFKQRISIIEKGGSIFSDVFSLNGQSKAKFLIKVESTGGDSCEFYLICNEFGSNKEEMKLNVKWWRENSNGEFGNKHESKLLFNSASNIRTIASGISVSLMKENSINDVLFVCCEIQYEEPANESDFEDEKEELIAHRDFSRKSFALHSEGYFDLIIKFGDKEVKASKVTLMACSEVFHRMLTCPNSIEAKTGIVKIENTKPEVIEALLRWIYQMEIDNMNEIALDLYKTADKYAIAPLKKKCVKFMIKSLSKENVAPYLILAYIHKEDNLKQHIIGFLHENPNNLIALMASDEWMKLCGEDAEEAKKILVDING